METRDSAVSAESESILKKETLVNMEAVIESGQNPLSPVPTSLRSIEGIDKLRRSIAKELKNGESGGFDEKCSNLPQLISILQYILLREKAGSVPDAVLKPFSYTKGSITTRFLVDIVSMDRDEWIKVSARNPKSLALLAAGGGGFGQRSILDHARDYLQCAEQNYSFFKPPKVTFVFTSGIGTSLAHQLESMGVRVEGERIQDSELAIRPRIKAYQNVFKTDSDSDSSEASDDESETVGNRDRDIHSGNRTEIQPSFQFKNPSLDGITKLNLDITALLAFVSNLTNGHTNVKFKTAILSKQLEYEKIRPQKDVLDNIFCGRELCCCQTALLEFQSILNTVGGPQEKQRAEEFLKRVTIVPDEMSLRSKSLTIVGNIKLRSLTIFGTGDFIEAVTVTANSGFVRSAISQGVEFPVFLHESRALTEGKENIT